MSFNNNNKLNRLIAIVEDLQGDITNIQNLINTYLTKAEAAALYHHILQFASPLTQPTPYSLSVDLTSYATQAFVATAINSLIDSAPASLNTLKELAAALNNDAVSLQL